MTSIRPDPHAPAAGAAVLPVLRGVLAVSAYLVVTIALMPLQFVLLVAGAGARERLPVWYHRFTLRLVGLRVRVLGDVSPGPALLAANHASWLDIPVLSSIAPLSFVAKSEVRSWPLFGQLARLQRTVFVDRNRRLQAGSATSEMERRFGAGDRLVLFAEGTSGDGNAVLPFRTALFGASAVRSGAPGGGADRPLRVQPVSIAYAGLQGMPMGRLFRPDFAWYGDMDLGPHFWRVFCAGPVDAVVRLHEPVTLDGFPDRKALARYCEETVRAGVASALLGRELDRTDTEAPGAAPVGRGNPDCAGVTKPV